MQQENKKTTAKQRPQQSPLVVSTSLLIYLRSQSWSLDADLKDSLEQSFRGKRNPLFFYLTRKKIPFSFGRRESLRGSAFNRPSEETVALFGGFREVSAESACVAITELDADGGNNIDNVSFTLLVKSCTPGQHLDGTRTPGQ